MATWKEAIEHILKGGEALDFEGCPYALKYGTQVTFTKEGLENDWQLLPILVSWQEAFRAMIVDGKRAMCAAYNDIVYKFERGQFIANKDCVNCVSFDIPSHVKADHKWEILS